MKNDNKPTKIDSPSPSEEIKKKHRQNSNPYDNLYLIWYILKKHSSRDNPLTAGKIHQLMKETREDAPSQKTISTLLQERQDVLAYIFASHVIIPSKSAVQKILREQHDSSILVNDAVKISCLAKNKNKFINYDDYISMKESKADNGELSNQGNSARFYYLETSLHEGEWKILYDLIRFTPWISKSQTEHLLEVIHRLGGMPYINDEVLYPFKRENQNQFDIIHTLERGIREQKKVAVRYGTYILRENQGKLVPHLEQLEKKGQKLLVPLSLVWSKGNYYLVARYQESGTMHLRVDRMLNVMLTNEPFSEKPNFSVVEHRDRSPMMYGGEQKLIRFSCPSTLLNTVMDFFGNTPSYQLDGDNINVHVRASKEGTLLFALEYIRQVEILEPVELREEIAEILKKNLEKYSPN